MKTAVLTFTTLLALELFMGMLFIAHTTLAYSLPGYSVGSSRLVQDSKTYISGEEITDPDTKLTLNTDRPILFGYTIDNVQIKVVIVSDDSLASSTHITVSDDDGYWVHQEEDALEDGDYTILMSIIDQTGTSSAMEMIGSFTIPEVLPEIIQTTVDRRKLIPDPSLHNLNYLTISLIVISAMLVVTLFYIFVRIVHTIKGGDENKHV